MRRAAFPLSIALLGVAVFLAWMHPAVLRPTNVGWLLAGEDRGQAAIGLLAYLRAGGPWPGLHEPLLDAPEGLALLFTDSIPLLGLLLKPFAAWLPGNVQLIGPWYLLCVLLQAGFAAMLVRPHARDNLGGWLGTALLTFSPVLLNRFGHASLCAQWLILWTLWIFVDQGRSRQPGWWVAVLALAALIHSYLLLTVASIWASAMLAAFVKGPDRGRVLLDAALTALPIAALVALHGVFGAHYASTESYGVFPVPLDAWWNPANPDYTALMPSSPQIEGRGFEGFQYLGAGLLALCLAAAALVARAGPAARWHNPLGRLAWLLPAFAVLAVLAIGPAPLWRGQPLFVIALPPAWTDALDPIRASGRLAWPITYTLIYAIVVIICRQPRATLLLGAAVALQLVDLMPMLAAVRATSARAEDARTYTRTMDPRWPALIAGAGAIEFEPPENFRDLQLMEEVAWRAVRACRPLTFFYSSRRSLTTAARLEADTRAFRAGHLDPRRLYILLGDAAPPPSVASRTLVIDRIRIIPPSRLMPQPGSCGPRHQIH